MRSLSIEVVQAGRDRDEKAFLDFPYDLYRDDYCWAPPLRSEERRFWRVEHNATLAPRWCRRFVARRGGETVGRVAAIVDPDFCSTWEDHTGFFGFIEFVDDREVSSALLNAAEAALKEQGIRRVIGPVGLSFHNEVGLLIRGFDAPQMILTPHNPRYYEAAILDAGYHTRHDYHSFLWKSENVPSESVGRLVRIAERSVGQKVVLRSINTSQWHSDIRLLFDIYNRAFKKIWGYTPITWREFEERAERFKKFMEPDLVVIAEVDGIAVGIGVTLPDINQALSGMNGRIFPLGWLKGLVRARNIDEVRFVLLGVLPEYEGKGVAVLIAHRGAEMAHRHGYKSGELSLVLESNQRARRVIEAFGGVLCKTFRLFGKSLS